MRKRIGVVVGIMAGVLVVGTGGDAADLAPSRDLQTVFQAGVEAFQHGRYEDAVGLLEQCVEIDPNFAPSYNYLGLVHQHMGAPWTDVIWLYNVAIEIEPEYAEAYLNRCRAHSQADQPDEAEASCLTALTIDPHLGSAELSLGWIYLMGKSDAKTAITYFERVLDRGVKHPVVYQGLGMAYAMDGNRGKVLDVVTQLRALGEEERAVNLEHAMRNSSGAQAAAPAAPSVSPSAPGQLVPARPAPVAESAAAPPANGMMRVRLRGQLRNVPTPRSSPPASASKAGGSAREQWHPGSLSVEPGADGNEDSESAIDRIRRLQRLRSTVPVSVTVDQP